MAGYNGGILMQPLSGKYSGQTFGGSKALPSDYFSSLDGSSSSTSNINGSGGSSIPSIAPPSLSPYTYSADAQSYPTYLRNLGENTAQQQFQRATNRIGAGNSQQNLMHAQDQLNQNRLAYMSQAGQQQLGVDNALADNWNKTNALLAQLYGTQVQQRGQDVGYAGQIGSASLQANARSPNGGVMTMGGGNSQLASLKNTDNGYWGGMSLSNQNSWDADKKYSSAGGWV